MYNNEDGELEGYWFYNDEQDGGTWIKEDGLSTGEWYYDEGTTESGTWLQNGDVGGTWYQDADDATLRIGSSYSDDECADTNNGAVDSMYQECSYYSSDPTLCGTYDTEYFQATAMCCVCGGGSTYTYDDDISTDDADGIVYD